MNDTVIQTLKKFFWFVIANPTIEDIRLSIEDETSLRFTNNRKNATLHLQKKHMPFLVKKMINQSLDKQAYSVSSIRYCIHGMDVFITQK